MTNQRLQKLEMIIKSHFTLTITKSLRSYFTIGKFKVGYALTNYSLDITGTLNINGQEAKLNDIIWKPKYNDYRLTKYINQNLNEAMSKDYAEAMPGVVKGLTEKIILKPHHLFHLHFNWRECKDSMGDNIVN